MKIYLSYFKLKFKTGLQYKAAAYAGIATQIFFGIVYISVYAAFYESSKSSVPMPYDQLVSYVWLCQAFFSLVYIWTRDRDILNIIKNGNIAYELCRPQDLYGMWFSKIYGEKLSKVILRFIPVLLLGIILPYPYHLSLKTTLLRFIIFILSFLLASILVTALMLFYHIICLFTLDEKGIVNMLMVISDIFSGLLIPIPFFPTALQKVINIFPFRYISDFPFRLYVGNISINEGLYSLLIQIIWIIILIVSGRLLMKKALKRAVIQGG